MPKNNQKIFIAISILFILLLPILTFGCIKQGKTSDESILEKNKSEENNVIKNLSKDKENTSEEEISIEEKEDLSDIDKALSSLENESLDTAIEDLGNIGDIEIR